MTQTVKRQKRLPNYRINVHALCPRHPLGVKPSGNALLIVKNFKALRVKGNCLLGDFSKFPEDLFLEILTFLDCQDLKNLSHCSRLFYAYTYGEELWRNLYIKEYCRLENEVLSEEITPFGNSKWKGSWRKSVLNIDFEALPQSTDLIFSDLLYRPYQCSQIDYRKLFKNIIELEEDSYRQNKTLNEDFGIKRFREGDLSREDFESKYINKPFILQSSAKPDRWPKWDLGQLCQLFGNEKFRQEAVQWQLSKYVDYARENKDESPLYLFDCNGGPIKKIAEQYETPDIFKDDLFTLFANGRVKCRPDHRWLIAGPKRSGSTFHKDPNQTSAWNTVLSGMKLWVMLPPDVRPPGISTDKDEDEVTAPVGISEWILSGFYNDSVQLAHQGECLIGVTFPGECLYVPSGWWHSVINITDTIAITENFVPEPVLGKVLYFLKNKRSQISGFHLKDVATSVDILLEKLSKDITKKDSASSDILRNFVNAAAKRELDNEDCGVKLSANLQVPIYEFFVELIEGSTYKRLLPKALDELQTIEKKNMDKSIKESSLWKDLKGDGHSNFSFQFSVE